MIIWVSAIDGSTLCVGLLPGIPEPRLMAYPRATVVDEKIEAMVSLGLTNSRMKEFHDMAVMASHFEFDSQELVKALAATFHRRKTALPKDPPPAFTDAFTKRPETIALWRAFIERESIHKDYSDLGTVADRLRMFLLPPASAVLIFPSDGHRVVRGRHAVTRRCRRVARGFAM